MIVVHNVEQQSEAWRKLKLGMPSASRFSDMMAEGKGISRRNYLYDLAGEFLSGEPRENYQNAAMLRGIEQEPMARAEYEFLTGRKVDQVGFISNGRCGCSPDGLISSDGAIEIKSAQPNVMVDIVLRENFPSEHKAQVQGTLLITGRKWVDLVVYHPKMPLYIRRAFPDAAYIRELDREVDRFNRDLKEIIRKVRSYRGAR